MRRAKTIRPVIIPRELQKQLPFKDKPKVLTRKKDEVQSKRVAIVREPRERKVVCFFAMYKRTNYNTIIYFFKLDNEFIVI